MNTVKYPSIAEAKLLLRRPTFDVKEIEKLAETVLTAVKKFGDLAVREYTIQFDKTEVEKVLVEDEEIDRAEKEISIELKAAIEVAKNTITKFHSLQKAVPIEVETALGVICWRKNVAIQKVGLYIPGGSAPLFSTVLMLGIPAQLAECKEVILCTPPNKDGRIHPAILYTAKLCGITKIYKIGGIQAIGAMAYGTESIPKVDKIFGPGNQYVTTAKQLVSKEGVAIDMPAGPSELAIIADHTANAQFIAADLLSQAEHGPDSQVLLICTDEELSKIVLQEISTQLDNLPRKDIATKALSHSYILLVATLDNAMEIMNDYAPEHLIIATENPYLQAEKVLNAGSVFLGNFTPEAAGDYASGTNHTLPTNGNAKAFSGVSLDSFYKKITFQIISEEGIKNIGPSIAIMAENEMLDAHKNAVIVRL